MADAERARPPTSAPFLRTVARGAAVSCPRCGERRLFRRWFSMPENCPRCALRFERKEGAFLGSLLINYSFAGIIGFGTMILGMISGWSLLRLMVVCFAVVTGSLVLFFPVSKTLWAAFDLLITDPDDVEHDARAIPRA